MNAKIEWILDGAFSIRNLANLKCLPDTGTRAWQGRGAMTNRARTVAALVVALGGCGSASQTYDAQGREAYTVNCSGWVAIRR